MLVDRGFAVRDDAGRFELGIRALGLASRSAELPLRDRLRGVAAWLLRATTRIRLPGGPRRQGSVYIAKEEVSEPVRLVTTIGSRTAAFAAASGRVHLGALAARARRGRSAARALVTPSAAACAASASCRRSSPGCAATASPRTTRRPPRPLDGIGAES